MNPTTNVTHWSKTTYGFFSSAQTAAGLWFVWNWLERRVQGSLAVQPEFPDFATVQRRLVSGVHAAEPGRNSVRPHVARQLRPASRLVLHARSGDGDTPEKMLGVRREQVVFILSARRTDRTHRVVRHVCSPRLDEENARVRRHGYPRETHVGQRDYTVNANLNYHRDVQPETYLRMSRGVWPPGSKILRMVNFREHLV